MDRLLCRLVLAALALNRLVDDLAVLLVAHHRIFHCIVKGLVCLALRVAPDEVAEEVVEWRPGARVLQELPVQLGASEAEGVQQGSLVLLEMSLWTSGYLTLIHVLEPHPEDEGFLITVERTGHSLRW